MLLTVLDRALRLLHPVMPFLTEELWQRLPGHEASTPETICLAPYPTAEPTWHDEVADQTITLLKGLVMSVRNARVEAKVPAKSSVALYLSSRPEGLERLGHGETDQHLRALAGVSAVEISKPPAGPWTGVVSHTGGEVKYAVRPEISVGRTSTPEEAASRRRAELQEVEEQIARAVAFLASPGFIEKAPAAVVEGRRRRLAELEGQRAELLAGLITETAES